MVNSVKKKIKLAKITSVRNAPRWADMRKFGTKRAKSRRINISKIKRWRRTQIKV
ncbi:MAG: hypothetical protein HYW22_01215 [Candidatus Aenigmarchaeota archaeon]|nr:hypothetical protein [Candidatus Aenigmarchaeota archaeon]